ncbi:MAG: type II secretion system protein GspM [Gallionella sp.]
MKQYWERASTAIDELSLRERAMIFIAAAFVVIALMNVLLLEPLSAKQKLLSSQVTQQQEKMKELQAQMQGILQAKRDDGHSPLRVHLAQLKQQLKDQDSYLQGRTDRLIQPDKMADLLRKVLDNNGSLQLVELKTLPVSPLIEPPQGKLQGNETNPPGNQAGAQQRQIFKHGVQITVRGRYLDLIRYITTLEKLPEQMFWGEVSLDVEKYPDSLFTLTLYTLSLDKTWLAV